MVQHLVNAQCLDPLNNISSTATVIDAETNDTNQHYHENSAQHKDQHHVLWIMHEIPPITWGRYMLTLLSCVRANLYRFRQGQPNCVVTDLHWITRQIIGSPNCPINRVIKFRTYSKNIDPWGWSLLTFAMGVLVPGYSMGWLPLSVLQEFLIYDFVKGRGSPQKRKFRKLL